VGDINDTDAAKYTAELSQTVLGFSGTPNVRCEDDYLRNVSTFTPEGGLLTVADSTLKFQIEAFQLYRFMSIASMILPTNDTFMAL